MSEETAEYQVTKSTSNLTTLADVVSDIQKNLEPALKEEVANMPEAELIQFHQSWGRDIRNRYNLWRNPALLKDIGKAHPAFDASMVIIKSVWQQLQDAENGTYTFAC